MIDVTLPLDLVGANKLLRMHWRERKQYQTHVLNHLVVAGVRWRERQPAKQAVTITRILGPKQRRMDTDNAHASCKQVLDGLKKQGVIFDDSPAWIDLTVNEDSANRASGPAVRVRVEGAR
jgi:Holliday junction resolvase RusA-like endonuclease